MAKATQTTKKTTTTTKKKAISYGGKKQTGTGVKRCPTCGKFM